MSIDRTLSIAPMMMCTDRHYRYLMRLITKRTLLYTEMITTGAIIHGDRERLLAYSDSEHPLALQLGGSDPKQLAECARIAEQFAYDEINLNVGCPSDRVQAGRFGACLMREPELVADCVANMRDVLSLPVTVKTRIGVDDHDSYEALTHFIETVAQAGCQTFIMHARKAWLKGLSPRENRNVPPLRYEVVQQIKKDFPHLEIIINGGIKTVEDVQQHLATVDGVMIGREVYSHPYLFADVDRLFFNEAREPSSRLEILKRYLPYISEQLQEGVPLRRLTTHLVGLFQGCRGAKRWRRELTELPRQEVVDVPTSILELASEF